jgi:BirA family transcriptional regulator, biotin operon repressor / biotin---[acetyl-CoA-carboxylase] ligase
MKLSNGKNEPLSRDWFGLDSFQPGPRFIRDGGRLYLLEEVGSTNDFLLGRGGSATGRLCVAESWGWQSCSLTDVEPVNDPHSGMVVVSHRQTNGRGRQGRPWHDCGGLHMSVVIPPHRASFGRGFSVWLGLLVVLCLREEFNLDVRLKWPNDIVIGDQKLGGLLLESAGVNGRTVIVAGLGLNLDTEPGDFPVDLAGQATSLSVAGGRTVKPGEVAGSILQKVEAELDVFDSSGWDSYRPALSCVDCLLGRHVVLSSGGLEFCGKAVGIDDGGALLLENSVGETATFNAGDVHILSHNEAESTPCREEVISDGVDH